MEFLVLMNVSGRTRFVSRLPRKAREDSTEISRKYRHSITESRWFVFSVCFAQYLFIHSPSARSRVRQQEKRDT